MMILDLMKLGNHIVMLVLRVQLNKVIFDIL
jgi:hypothetical protein